MSPEMSPEMSPVAGPVRLAIAAALVAVALLLQVSFFGAFAWQGVVPDLVLLVVVAGALARGGQFGIVLGFAAGVLLDLTPPADHTAGRWALALLVVGYVAGLVRQDRAEKPAALTVVATVAACSFVGTSVFALTGLLLHEGTGSIGGMLRVIGISLVWDVVLTPFVLPWTIALFGFSGSFRRPALDRPALDRRVLDGRVLDRHGA